MRGAADLRLACVNSVAIVGSRAATGYGQHVAIELAAVLGERGVVTVSGGAYTTKSQLRAQRLCDLGRPVMPTSGRGPDILYSMYGLSPDSDLNPLNGCTLTFVGFGEYQLQLTFSGDVDCSISIEGDYTVAPMGHQATTYSAAVAGAQALLPILGHTVGSTTVPNNGTVRVVFDDGSVIEVLDSSSQYESYQVNLGSRLLIV